MIGGGFTMNKRSVLSVLLVLLLVVITARAALGSVVINEVV